MKRLSVFIYVCMFSACFLELRSQNPVLDSLHAVWMDKTAGDTVRSRAYLRYIREGFMFNDPDSAFVLAGDLVKFAESRKFQRLKGDALAEQGVSLYVRSRNVEALNYYRQALKIHEEIGNTSGVVSTLGNIGIIYAVSGYSNEAIKTYERALGIAEKTGDKIQMAYNLTNIGNEYKEQGKDSLARQYLERSIDLFEETNNSYGLGTALGNLGQVYYELGKFSKAYDQQKRSLEIRRQLNDQRGIMYSYKDLGLIGLKERRYNEAIKNCKASLQIGEKIASVIGKKHACECLYNAYKALGKGEVALEYHEKVMAFDVELEKNETARNLQRMEFDKQMREDSIKTAAEKALTESTHKKEVNEEKESKNWFMIGGILALLIAIGFYIRWRYVHKSKAALQIEKDRSENLLHNILPEEIAAELKEKGKAEARDFELVSVLFTDFKGFTQKSETMAATELVTEINHCFEAFDAIAGKYGIEKIKTIGDAYLAAGGLPVPSEDSVKRTVLAAMEMQDFIIKRHRQQESEGRLGFEMRVGVHTGPVVAGIVGVKKYQYDIWGDTVNTASRMESSGEVGKVNISKSTYELIKDDPDLQFESRGMIDAKGKGKVEMYFVNKRSN